MPDIKEIRKTMRTLYSEVPGFFPVYVICDCSKLPARFFGAYADPDDAADQMEKLLSDGINASYYFLGVHTKEKHNTFPNVDFLVLFFYEKLPDTLSENKIAAQAIYSCDDNKLIELVEEIRQKYNSELPHNSLFQMELSECDQHLKYEKIEYFPKSNKKMQA